MPNSPELMINLAVHPRDLPVTELNGPGQRFPLWTQGCALRCTDECISPQLLEHKPRHLLAVSSVLAILAERARRAPQPIEGITFLGGEPTDQAAPLAAIATTVQEWGWSVMTYSGHTLERLRARCEVSIAELLLHTDILVDGPFVRQLANPLLRWRGSSNQRILVLSKRYDAVALAAQPVTKGVDITLTREGRLLISGAQSKAFVEKLADNLSNLGVLSVNDCP
jgi:anaerobic ribonucleoside-triphosphate reductase activating protein